MLNNVLWLAGFISTLTLMGVLLVKRCHRDFPFFLAFVGYALVETISLFFVAGHGSVQAYTYTYWSFAVGDYILQIGLVYEMARKTLRFSNMWIGNTRRNFLTWSILGGLIAAGLALAVTPLGKHGLSLWSIRSSIFTSFLTCEVFLAMAHSANRLGLQWRSRTMSLGQGLTAWAAVGLLDDVVHVCVGWQKDLSYLDSFRSFASVASVIFWAVSFASPEREVDRLAAAEFDNYVSSAQNAFSQDLNASSSIQ